MSKRGKWFESDPEKNIMDIKPVSSKDKILGSSGLGGVEISGSMYAVLIDGRTYIFGGYRDSIRGPDGNALRDPNGRRGFYGERWYDVHFSTSINGIRADDYQRQKFHADSLSNDADHRMAVQIAIEFLSLLRVSKPDITPFKEIQFTSIPIWSDPRNPKEIIKVNQNVS